jgi:signal transduction histidine kinase/CheY-like chemotaxis protein/Pyruvate/2-oxoacid:ferredoxin oxidoreductase delta subunit
MGTKVKRAVTDPELCVCCNLCIRVCPAETANVVYVDDEGRIRIRVDPDYCLGCGACAGVCGAGARKIEETAGKQPKPCVPPVPSESGIEAAFTALDKSAGPMRRIDCGACGSESCLGMARKIALNVNIPLNCIVKARADMLKERRRNVELYRENAQYIELVHEIGTALLSVNEDDFSEVMLNALDALRSALGGCGAHLWKAVENNGEFRFTRVYGYPVQIEAGNEEFGEELLPGWIGDLSSGVNVGRNFSIMNNHEKKVFQDTGIASVLAVPIFIKGTFWGFLSLNSTYERSFSESGIAAITAGGLLIVSSVIDREMTESLIEAREAALAGTRAKSDFLSRMSHEIRTPMNAIIGMTKIAENTNDTGKLKYCLSTINGSSTHLLGLINDILDMSKIEAGKFDLDNVPFNLEKTLVKICDIIGEKTEQKHQVLSVLSDPGMRLYYEGDDLRLSQVITNLLSNAVKFTPEGGRITVRMEETAQSKRENGAPVSRLRFSVQDTGIGMSAEQMSGIFNPFQQADQNITRRFGGTGLGLAISRSIVEKMNGYIKVESEPGKGSTFIFEVELAITGAPEEEEQSYSGDLRILVVENDPELRELLIQGIEKFGMQADTAESGAGAAAMAARTNYDAALVEYRLPPGGGPDTGEAGLDEAKTLGAVLDPGRIIMISSFLEWNRVEEHAAEAGIRHFVSRPVFLSGLLDSINRASGRAIIKESPKNSGAARPDFSGVSMLFADDIDINREIFLAILEDTHIQIDVAEDGSAAVRKFRENPGKYDLIILDIQMPEMDGLEATRAIRAIEAERAAEKSADFARQIPRLPEQSSGVPIIAMTANVFKEDIEHCLEAGMNDHLKKPIEEQTLMEKIALYAGSARRLPKAI